MAQTNNKDVNIRIKRVTQSRMDKFKLHRRETYDDIISRMLDKFKVKGAAPSGAQAQLTGATT